MKLVILLFCHKKLIMTLLTNMFFNADIPRHSGIKTYSCMLICYFMHSKQTCRSHITNKNLITETTLKHIKEKLKKDQDDCLRKKLKLNVESQSKSEEQDQKQPNNCRFSKSFGKNAHNMTKCDNQFQLQDLTRIIDLHNLVNTNTDKHFQTNMADNQKSKAQITENIVSNIDDTGKIPEISTSLVFKKKTQQLFNKDTYVKKSIKHKNKRLTTNKRNKGISFGYNGVDGSKYKKIGEMSKDTRVFKKYKTNNHCYVNSKNLPNICIKYLNDSTLNQFTNKLDVTETNQNCTTIKKLTKLPFFKVFAINAKQKILRHIISLDLKNSKLSYYLYMDKNQKNYEKAIVESKIIRLLDTTFYIHGPVEIEVALNYGVENASDCEYFTFPYSIKYQNKAHLNTLDYDNNSIEMNGIISRIRNANHFNEIQDCYKNILLLVFYIKNTTPNKLIWNMTRIMPELIFYVEYQLKEVFNIVKDITAYKTAVLDELYQIIEMKNDFCLPDVSTNVFLTNHRVSQVDILRNLILAKMKLLAPGSHQCKLYMFIVEYDNRYGNHISQLIKYKFYLLLLVFTLDSKAVIDKYFIRYINGEMAGYHSMSLFIINSTRLKGSDINIFLTLGLLIEYLETKKEVIVDEASRIVFIRPYRHFYLVAYGNIDVRIGKIYILSRDKLLNILLDRFKVLLSCNLYL